MLQVKSQKPTKRREEGKYKTRRENVRTVSKTYTGEGITYRRGMSRERSGAGLKEGDIGAIPKTRREEINSKWWDDGEKVTICQKKTPSKKSLLRAKGGGVGTALNEERKEGIVPGWARRQRERKESKGTEG